MNISVLGLILVLIGLLGLIYKHKHLLLILLILEFCVLGIFFLIGIILMFIGEEIYFILLFIRIGVCEGALGLRILVHISRIYGNDYFGIIRVLEC